MIAQIKNIDAVDVAATNISCTNLTINGEPVSTAWQNLGESSAGLTTFTGEVKADTLTSNGAINAASVTSTTTNAGTLTSSSIVNTGSISTTSLAATGDVQVTGSLTVDTTTLKVDSVNNRVGIVNTTPTEALDVTGNCKVSGSGTFGSANVSGNLQVDSSTLFVNSSSNRVGICTTSPAQTLQVDGTALINNTATAAASMVGLSVLTPNATTVTNQVELLVGKNTGSLGNARLTYRSGGTSDTTYGAVGIAGTNPPIIFKPTQVMIGNTGSTTPTFVADTALQVQGNTRLVGNVDVYNYLAVDTDIFRVERISPSVSIVAPFTVTGAITFNGEDGSPAMVMDSTNKRVGILTTTPSEALDVVGNAKVSGNFAVDTQTLFVNASNNRVGINNSNPQNTLQVNGTALINNTASAAPSMVGFSVLTPLATAVTNQVEMLVGKDVNTLGNVRLTYRSGGTNATTYGAVGIAGSNPPIIFQPSQVMIGNTGSATPTFTPGYALDVKGDSRVTGALDVTSDVGVDGNISVAGNSTVIGTLDVTGNITVTGALTLGSQTVTNNIDYTSSTDATIGVTKYAALASDLNITSLNNTIQRITPSVTLTPGVWLCEGAVAYVQGTTSSTLLSRVAYGFNSSATNALPVATSSTWKNFNIGNLNTSAATGQADTWPVIPVTQVIRLTTSAGNVSLFANTQFTSSGGTINYRGSVCYARYTRLA